MQEYIAIIIAALGFISSVYYSNKNSRKQDIEEIKSRAAMDAKISTKLDGIAGDVRSSNKRLDMALLEIQSQSNRLVKVEESTKSAHHRIDELIKTHNRCCGAGQQYKEE